MTYTDEAIAKYAASKGADELATAWAKNRARNKLKAGKEADAAIDHGMNEIDLWLAVMPRINTFVAERCVRDAGMEARG